MVANKDQGKRDGDGEPGDHEVKPFAARYPFEHLWTSKQDWDPRYIQALEPTDLSGRSAEHGTGMHSIEELRAEIDRIDTAIVDLIAERQSCAGRMARAKYTEGLSIRDTSRRRQVLERAFDYAVERGVNPKAVQRVMELLVEMSEERQRECQGEGNLP